MPGNVAAAAPVDTFPTNLYSSFTIELRIENLLNPYPDGTSQRAALQVNPRYFFKLSFALTAAQWSTMRSFFLAHQGSPFYFYNLAEALPGPPPGDPIGRYVVVFDGPWSEELQPTRTRVTLNLREVA
jgi:hypothetical protein